MIDRSARRQLAQALRHFAIGFIDLEEFNNRIPNNSKDKTVNVLINIVQDSFWEKENTFRLVGDNKLNKTQRNTFNRMILFLYSNREYQWLHWIEHIAMYIILISFCCLILSLIFLHEITSAVSCLFCFFVFLLSLVILNSYSWIIDDFMEKYYWPFLKKTDLALTLSTPPYLIGKN